MSPALEAVTPPMGGTARRILKFVYCHNAGVQHASDRTLTSRGPGTRAAQRAELGLPGEQRPRNEVTAENIAEKLAKHRSIDLAPEQLQLEAPIAELGEHLVQVELGRGYSAALVVAVEPR